MQRALVIKLALVYVAFMLITFGFIQREKTKAGESSILGSLFWGILWPIYWLAICGPQTTLNEISRFLTRSTGFWLLYLLGIPLSFGVFTYVRWADNLLFSQGAWLLLKSLCMALVWPVFLFI